VIHAEKFVGRDIADLARKAASEFVDLAKSSVEASGRFVVALSGGETPKSLYATLASGEFCSEISWSRLHFFWGDERPVPPDDPDSNYRMAFETFLAKVRVPEKNIHRIPAEQEPEVAAGKYEKEIRDFFGLPEFAWPRFDLVLLGVGDDGHTASLFPDSDALRETRRLVVAPYIEKLRSYRITLTLPVLNHAANVFFLVAGEGKAAVLREVLEPRPGSKKQLPAQRIDPQNGKVLWFVDRAAAASLQS
jgi:6-phosphogluconolactonase